MSREPFVVASNHYPRPLQVVGEHITVLASGAETGGYEIFVQTGMEGSGPPPHSHPWDESFYILAGVVTFGIGADTCNASPGTLLHFPAGTTHWFHFGAGGGKMLSMTSGAGAAKMFADIDREISPGSPDLRKLIEVGSRHHLSISV